MYTLFFLLAVVLASLHLLLSRKPRTPLRITELLLVYLLFFSCGIGGLYAFMGHVFASDAVAQSIGWPTGSPFQLEIGATNLAFGVLGILCLFFRGLFPLATTIGYSIFLLGAACVHLHDIQTRGNLAEFNSGAFLYIQDFFVPLFLLGLAILYTLESKKAERAQSKPPR